MSLLERLDQRSCFRKTALMIGLAFLAAALSFIIKKVIRPEQKDNSFEAIIKVRTYIVMKCFETFLLKFCTAL